MQYSFVVPYLRSSPIHLPSRDIVVAASDSVLLSVSIIESDDPAAEALVLTGGIGGPTLRLTVWPDSTGWYCDYGVSTPQCGTVLWSGVGTISTTSRGTFDVLIPLATMANWPRRCVYALQLDWSGNTRSETLAQGHLHVRLFAINSSVAGTPRLRTDDYIPIDTDDNLDLFA
jgi:hypothetical protein